MIAAATTRWAIGHHEKLVQTWTTARALRRGDDIGDVVPDEIAVRAAQNLGVDFIDRLLRSRRRELRRAQRRLARLLTLGRGASHNRKTHVVATRLTPATRRREHRATARRVSSAAKSLDDDPSAARNLGDEVIAALNRSGKPLTLSAQLVLLVLLSWSSASGFVSANDAAVCAQTEGLTWRETYNAIAELQHVGFVARRPRGFVLMPWRWRPRHEHPLLRLVGGARLVQREAAHV